MTSPYTRHTLPNGLRIVIEHMPDVRSAAAGFLVCTGGRDETPELAGVSHFLEHMMFKGTAKRGWREINVDFDKLGSTYNAYTSEDRTVYYGWVRSGDLEPQVELLADMMRSQLPPHEFDMEKNVILEEIAMAKDQIEQLAVDFIHENVFAGHALAWPVLGYDHSVRALTRDAMWHYFQERYAPDNMYFIAAGNVDPARVIALAERYCGAWQPSGRARVRTAPRVHGGRAYLPAERFNQQIVAVAYPSVGAAHDLSETASALSSILGGENSRIYWNVVQAGLCPRAGAFYLDYADCGLLILWGAGEPDTAERILDSLRLEARRITDGGVQAHEVERVRNKRRTSLAVESEAPYYRLTQLFEDLDYYGEPRTIEQRLAEVDAVTTARITHYLSRFPITGEGLVVGVGPRNWPPIAS